MLSRSALRFFSKKKGKSKGDVKIQSKWKNKLNELFNPPKCEEIIDPKANADICAVNPSWPQPRIIIIGAGMAGLSAAQRLLQCGIHNFLILEATDRPGGRIHSHWMGNCMTELGAMWIEGACLVNLAFLLATQEGLISPPLIRSKVTENTTFFTSEGRNIEPHVAKTAIETFEELIESKAIMSELVNDNTSLGDFIETQLSKELSSIPCPLNNDISRVIGCLYNELRSRIGQDPCYVHSKAMAERECLPGGRIRIPLGFGSILAPLLRTLPPCSIMYCKPVHFILWGGGGKSRATVVCTDKEEFPADYVIVTTPLGVLKNDLDQMFCPPLPKHKKKAIKKLCFGDVERVYIQYDRPFWFGNEGIGLGWTLKELRENQDDWTRGLGELTGVPGSYATLQGTVGGAAAVAICDTPKSELIPQVGNLLRQFTGDATLPNPTDVQSSRWSRDPFFCGSCTFLGLDSRPFHLDVMAEPVPNPEEIKENPPILLFAGEATSSLHYSTVHGARETGIREAQRIIELTNFYRGAPSCKTCPPCPNKPKKAKK